MVFRMLAVLSEFERDVISERTSMAMKHLRANGRYTGGHEPYGFRFVEGALETVPQEAAVISDVQRLRSEGVSLRGICKKLTEQGTKARTGKPFQAVQVARMLRTPIQAREGNHA